jgi:hypothetical protein
MAINGSPLTRARIQENEVWMTRRRHEFVASIKQEDTQDARQALQILSTIDPRATRDPVVAQASAAVYEREIFERIVRTYPRTSLMDGPGDIGYDLIVETLAARIGVQIKGGRSALMASDLRNIVQAAVATRARGEVRIDGLLVVTSRMLPTDLSRRLRELREIAGVNFPVSVVRWIDEQDDATLEDSIQTLISRSNRPS